MNEILYDFKIRKTVSTLILKIRNKIFIEKQFRYRKKISNVTTFINVETKIYYDVRHTLLLLKLEDKIFLRLHREYKLLNKFNFKFFN